MSDVITVTFTVSDVRLSQDQDGEWKVRLTASSAINNLSRLLEKVMQVDFTNTNTLGQKPITFFATLGSRRQNAQGHWVLTVLVPMTETARMEHLSHFYEGTITLREMREDALP